MDERTLFDDLVQRVPQLEESFRSHLAGNEGLLPHLMMADVARFVVKECRGIDEPVVAEVLDCLTEALENNSDFEELMSVSLVEMFFGESEALDKIWPLLKDPLKSVFQSVHQRN